MGRSEERRKKFSLGNPVDRDICFGKHSQTGDALQSSNIDAVFCNHFSDFALAGFAESYWQIGRQPGNRDSLGAEMDLIRRKAG